METNTVNTATASTIHKEILLEEKLIKDNGLSFDLRIKAQNNVVKLKRELNRINYEASLQASC